MKQYSVTTIDRQSGDTKAILIDAVTVFVSPDGSLTLVGDSVTEACFAHGWWVSVVPVKEEQK